MTRMNGFTREREDGGPIATAYSPCHVAEIWIWPAERRRSLDALLIERLPLGLDEDLEQAWKQWDGSKDAPYPDDLLDWFRTVIRFPRTRAGWRAAWRVARRIAGCGWSGIADVAGVPLEIELAPTARIVTEA